jgi:hypothetical protein
MGNYYYPLVLTLAGSVPSIRWLINKLDERKFCRKACKEAKDCYIQLRQISSKNKSSFIRRLQEQTEGLKKAASGKLHVV